MTAYDDSQKSQPEIPLATALTGDAPAAPSAPETPRYNAAPLMERLSLGAPTEPPPKQQKAPAERPAPQQPKPIRYRSGLLMVLVYALGSMAPVVLKQGRRPALWAVVGLISVAAWAATLWKWAVLRVWLENGTAPLLPWVVVMVVLTFAGITLWSRALFLSVKDPRFIPERLPKFFKHPVVAGMLGIILPGSGLMISGHPRRAFLALWNLAPLVLGTIVLWQAAWLWQCNRSDVVQGIPLLTLEAIYLATVLVGFISVLTWVGSALDGGRLTALRSGKKSGPRSDWLALAALILFTTFGFTMHPSSMAKNLDEIAAELQQREYRLIPLCMEVAATHLDASKPKYLLESAKLYDSLGQYDRARDIRGHLEERWKVYAEMLMMQDIHSEDLWHPEPIESSALGR